MSNFSKRIPTRPIRRPNAYSALRRIDAELNNLIQLCPKEVPEETVAKALRKYTDAMDAIRALYSKEPSC